MSADFKPIKIGECVLDVWLAADDRWRVVVDEKNGNTVEIGHGDTQHDAVMAAKDFLRKLNKALPDGRATRYGKDSK